jgi:hypothetical protein
MDLFVYLLKFLPICQSFVSTNSPNGILLCIRQEDEHDTDDDEADTSAEEAEDSADAKPEDGKVAADEKVTEDSKDVSAEEKKHVC